MTSSLRSALADVGLEVLCPSYRRGHQLIETAKYFPFVQAVVSESEADQYRKNGNAVVVCPDAVQGNKCRVMNWILDRAEAAGLRGVLMLDDDVQFIARYDKRVDRKLNDAEFAHFVWNGFQMAEDCGVYLWGVNIMPDKMSYRENTPLGFVKYIGGPFQAVRCGVGLRYDERLSLKDDYDFTLQNLNKHRRTLRFNQYHYGARQNEQTGGDATYRTVDEEKRQNELMIRKWGGRIVQHDMLGASRKNRQKALAFDLNLVIKPPIAGV